MKTGLAAQGATVLCSIHQPNSEIFGLFDDLVLLAQTGEVAYQGPADQCVPFLARCGHDILPGFSAPDFIIQTVSQCSGQDVSISLFLETDYCFVFCVFCFF